MSYDSRPDTYEHIQKAQEYLDDAITDLLGRRARHDQSKLVPPELDMFNEFTPRLADAEYGTEEYKAVLREMQATGGLDHHYDTNDHHPEYFEKGIEGMDLLQVLEMLCDWKAAGERPGGIPIRESIQRNLERFDFGLEMMHLLLNTVERLQWK